MISLQDHIIGGEGRGKFDRIPGRRSRELLPEDPDVRVHIQGQVICAHELLRIIAGVGGVKADRGLRRDELGDDVVGDEAALHPQGRECLDDIIDGPRAIDGVALEVHDAFARFDKLEHCRDRLLVLGNAAALERMVLPDEAKQEEETSGEHDGCVRPETLDQRAGQRCEGNGNQRERGEMILVCNVRPVAEEEEVIERGKQGDEEPSGREAWIGARFENCDSTCSHERQPQREIEQVQHAPRPPVLIGDNVIAQHAFHHRGQGMMRGEVCDEQRRDDEPGQAERDGIDQPLPQPLSQ